MTGIFLLLVISLWIALAIYLAKLLRRALESYGLRWAKWGAMTYLLLMLPMPVADEIIGGFQLYALCKKGTVLKIDEEAIKGKTVRAFHIPLGYPEYVKNTVAPILHQHVSYRDVVTAEEYAFFDTYRMEGGKFINLLQIVQNPSPLVIPSTNCYPPLYRELAKKYQFTLAK